MKHLLRFFNSLPVIGGTFEGSVPQLLKHKNLTEVSKVVITQAPDKKEMENLVEIMRSQPQIKILSLAEIRDLPDAAHEALANGLSTLNTLTHLCVDGTKLSSRSEPEKEGLKLVIQEVGKNSSLKYFAATSHLPSGGPSHFHPLRGETLKDIAKTAVSSKLINLNFEPFWVAPESQKEFFTTLQNIHRPCPNIEFDNLRVTAGNLHALLAQDRKLNENTGELRTLFASQRPIGFKN